MRRIGLVLLVVSAVLWGAVSVAAASSSDDQTTHAYLVAQYRVITTLLRETTKTQGIERVAAKQIAQECPGVLSGMPRETYGSRLSASSPRSRGESARLDKQKETLEAELASAVGQLGDNSTLPVEEAYAAEVRGLSWSDPAITSTVQAATAASLEAASRPVPRFCVDASAWAQSGYRDLSQASREFEASRTARRHANRTETRSVETLLNPYENREDRVLIEKTDALEAKLLLSAETAVQTVSDLDRIVGLPGLEIKKPKDVTVGHGRTAASTHFQVNSGSSAFGDPGCHRSATVAYTRPNAPDVLIVGGPNNPICLSRPHYRHPALFCEVGLETIQTAVPAAVRSVRLVLANGRTIKSRVVRVPRRHGGPGAIYAQQIRGSKSHAVSLIELNAAGETVLTVRLPRYHCVKRSNEPSEFPAVTNLASGHTPEGEPFTLSAFGQINNEPFISVDAGVNPELSEPAFNPGASKPFAWSLSIGCAPHPYAILYGILAPPGKSVVAQTPQGTVGLNVVSVPSRVHAKGPLVYGVFNALPSELTVLAADGSSLYAENLQDKATEVAQFCEGYAEP